MPLYDFQCTGCGTQEEIYAGVDDDTAICQACGGLMLRPDPDIFRPYFEGSSDDIEVPVRGIGGKRS